MTQAIVGKVTPFVVHCFNGAQPPVEVTDTNGPITVSVVDPLTGTATCDPDGKNGQFVALLATGQASIVARDGTLTSQPYVLDLVPDPAAAPATLVVAGS